jgi:hypothetical protein
MLGISRPTVIASVWCTPIWSVLRTGVFPISASSLQRLSFEYSCSGHSLKVQLPRLSFVKRLFAHSILYGVHSVVDLRRLICGIRLNLNKPLVPLLLPKKIETRVENVDFY